MHGPQDTHCLYPTRFSGPIGSINMWRLKAIQWRCCLDSLPRCYDSIGALLKSDETYMHQDTPLWQIHLIWGSLPRANYVVPAFCFERRRFVSWPARYCNFRPIQDWFSTFGVSSAIFSQCFVVFLNIGYSPWLTRRDTTYSLFITVDVTIKLMHLINIYVNQIS